MKVRLCLLALLATIPSLAVAQTRAPVYFLEPTRTAAMQHSFFDQQNLRLQGMNATSQTIALFAIQSHDNGGPMAPCMPGHCAGALEARGRTLDPLEKHFEDYGYGWGAAYRYVGGVGLTMVVAYACHVSGHHKLERWVPVVSIAHAEASTGYALTGSMQGKNGW
jgi:hypothetical protein